MEFFSALQKKRSDFENCRFFCSYFSVDFCYCSMAESMASVSSKRSLEARRMRSRRKKTKARVKARRSPYLMPEPCESVVHEDCVAIDCEMIVVQSGDPAERTALASVAIVNKDLKCVYEKFLQPPPHRRINQRSREYCPVTDQQFAIARHCPRTSFAEVRQDVLRILRR